MTNELKKLFLSKKRVFVLLMFLLIGILYFIHGLITDFHIYPIDPAYMMVDRMFLGIAYFWGTEYVMIALYVMPIWMLVIYTDILIKEISSGYSKLIIIKMGKTKYFIQKITSNFLITAGIMLTMLFINYVLVNISSIAYTNLPDQHTYLRFVESGSIAEKELLHPQISMLKKIFLTSFYTGLWGIITTNIIYLFKEKKFVYPLVFFSWFYLVGSRKFNVMIAIQPYIKFEYGEKYAFYTTISLLVVTLLMTLFTYLFVKREDDV